MVWRCLIVCQDGDLPNIVEVDDDKANLIKEVLQLQNTLDGLSGAATILVVTNDCEFQNCHPEWIVCEMKTKG
eukprot:m.13677 g.13677  ORF g.13677 m.13677 type:complete len:73 (-) comp10203_c0_seq1:317-535(-)